MTVEVCKLFILVFLKEIHNNRLAAVKIYSHNMIIIYIIYIAVSSAYIILGYISVANDIAYRSGSLAHKHIIHIFKEPTCGFGRNSKPKTALIQIKGKADKSVTIDFKLYAIGTILFFYIRAVLFVIFLSEIEHTITVNIAHIRINSCI